MYNYTCARVRPFRATPQSLFRLPRTRTSVLQYCGLFSVATSRAVPESKDARRRSGTVRRCIGQAPTFVGRIGALALILGALLGFPDHLSSQPQSDHESSDTSAAETRNGQSQGFGSEFEQRLWTQLKLHPGILKESLRHSAEKDRATFTDFVYPDPEVRISRGSGNQEERAAYPTNYSRKDATSYELQITQPIPFPGKLTAQANIQEYKADQKGFAFLMSRNQVLGKLLGLLARYHRTAESLRLTRELAGAAGALEGIARARYGAGKGSLSDVSLARVQADSFREKAEMLEGELEAIKEELDYFRITDAGEPESRTQPSETENGVQAYLLSKQAYRQYLKDIQNRQYSVEALPLVARIRAMQREAESRDTLARLNYTPDLGVFAAYGKEDRNLIYPSGTGKQTTYKLGISIRVPLWSGLSNHNQVEATDKERKAARLEQLDVERQIRAKISSLDEKIQKGRSRESIFNNRLVPNAWTARRSSVLSYQGGSADFTSVIQAWNAYYQVNLQKLALEEQIALWIIERSELTNTFLLNAEAGYHEN
ncbi:MAG: hypothetical protein CMN76_04940 [Spirochaetaceae bacterium]|nr:hypothetical protein [Spirochaetaceae bacterium]